MAVESTVLCVTLPLDMTNNTWHRRLHSQPLWSLAVRKAVTYFYPFFREFGYLQ